MERRMRGLLGGDPVAWARTHGAELVDFAADRSGTASLRDHVRAVLAMEQGAEGLGAMADQLLRRARLSHLASTRVDRLTTPARVVLALVEVAAGAAYAPRSHPVVVPEPPLPWPARHEVRLAAMQLLGAGELVLHATDLAELLPLVTPEAIETTDGVTATAADPRGVLLVRVFAPEAPYQAFLAALRARGVRVEGGPVAHRLEGPVGFTARDVLAAAHETEVDVLEVRPAFPATGEAAPVVDAQPPPAVAPAGPPAPSAASAALPAEASFEAYDGTDPFAEVEARERADKGSGPGDGSGGVG